MKNAMMAFALLLLAGCATKEMKSTPFYEGSDVVYAGKPEDRVNVWPIAYWREPVGSVLWPMTSFSDDHFALRPIYSQYKQDGKDGAFDEFNFLWPLSQADTKNDDYFVFPFFWGKDSKQHPYQALFPIYWNGDGYNSLFPLWHWNRDGSLFTPLGGRTISGATTNVYVTPLVKATSGEKTGGMVFPVWGHEKNSDFDKKTSLSGSERLDDTIRIWTSIETNRVWNKKTKSYGSKVQNRCRAKLVYAHDKTNWLLLFPWNDIVNGSLGCGSSTNSYELVRTIKRGNGLLLDYEHKRKATYSALDRSKQSDTEESEASFLIWLYNYRRESDLMKGDAYTQHRVLWRLWDWEEKDGDVSLDVFPGFTYDSKTNGYAKTSFLWRFFRYESDPEKGTAADFLFIPVWR